jgi:sugar phosphate isomerase/epimerase
VRVGIDSYSFHRYFGDWYPGLQEDPGVTWTMVDDFVDYAVAQGAEEVALETRYFPALDPGYCDDLRARLDEAGILRTVGWGDPHGLCVGTSPEALAELEDHIPNVPRLGAGILRIVGGSMRTTDEPHEPQIEALVPVLRRAAKVAADHGVVLAIENHLDFTSAEIVELIERTGVDNLKVNFDFGNAVRIYEDVVKAARRLAPLTVSTHVKDIFFRRPADDNARTFTFWPSCALGDGAIDVEGAIQALGEEGYDGGLCVELDYIAPWMIERGEEALVADSLSYLRRTLAGQSST